MKNKVEVVHIISGITLILISLFLVIYYNLIIEDHTGMIDWWAIVILVIPALTLCLCRVYIEFDPIYENDENFLKKIINTISEILLLPFLLIYLLICLFIPTGIVGKKTFKKLIDKGFTYKYKNKTYILTRNNIVIQILLDLENYYISFDGGVNYSRIEESQLGFQYNRDELKFRLHEYKYAHPVDRQRGDAKPPISYYVDFLANFIE